MRQLIQKSGLKAMIGLMTKLLSVTFGASLFLIISASIASASSPEAYGLREGEVIRAAGDFDVYIVNNFGMKRLFLNPVIFGFYGHLGFAKVKEVSPSVRDAFPTSGYFKNCENGDDNVYALEKIGEDAGILRHINLSSTEVIDQDAFFFEKVFCINAQEFTYYKVGSRINSLSSVPEYSRASQPFINIGSPWENEREYWREGQNLIITWVSHGISRINISAAVGGHDRGIIITVNAQGPLNPYKWYESYSWQIPIGFITDMGLNYSDDVSIMLEDADNPSVYDISGPVVTITKALDGTEGWKTYYNGDMGIEFRYPIYVSTDPTSRTRWAVNDESGGVVELDGGIRSMTFSSKNFSGALPDDLVCGKLNISKERCDAIIESGSYDYDDSNPHTYFDFQAMTIGDQDLVAYAIGSGYDYRTIYVRTIRGTLNTISFSDQGSVYGPEDEFYKILKTVRYIGNRHSYITN